MSLSFLQSSTLSPAQNLHPPPSPSDHHIQTKLDAVTLKFFLTGATVLDALPSLEDPFVIHTAMTDGLINAKLIICLVSLLKVCIFVFHEDNHDRKFA